ncbi:MAG: FUSC family protein [Alkaliphilus sp.]
MKIGLRTIKTGLAVSLSMLIANILSIESSFIIIVTAFITIRPSIADSWKIGVNRILGTFIGAFVGVVFLMIYPANFLLAGIGVIIVIWIINRLGWKEAVTIGGIVFTSIYLYAEGNFFYHALNRLLATIIGITIAVVINYFVYPPDYVEKATTKMAGAMRDIWATHINLLERILDEDCKLENLEQEEIYKIEEELNEAEELLKLQADEEKVRIYNDNNYKEKQIILKMIKKTTQYLHNIYAMLQDDIDEKTIGQYREDLGNIKKALQEHKDIETKLLYNKKAANFLKEMEDVSKIKNRIKFEKNEKTHSTEDIVRMFVWMYNLEETLSKFNIIAERQGS